MTNAEMTNGGEGAPEGRCERVVGPGPFRRGKPLKWLEMLRYLFTGLKPGVN